MLPLTFLVKGRPAPQGSKTYMPGKSGGKGRYIEKSKYVGQWREAVAAAVHTPGRLPIEDAVSVAITFIIERPAKHHIGNDRSRPLREGVPIYLSHAPDLDKLVRATNDGLKMGGLLKDDSLIVSSREVKMYAAPGNEPGALIEVRVIEKRQ